MTNFTFNLKNSFLKRHEIESSFGKVKNQSMKTIENQSKNDELKVSLNKLSDSTNKQLEESKHSNKDSYSLKSTKNNDEFGVKKVLNTLRCFFNLDTKVLLYFIFF